AVVQKINLALALELAVDRVANDPLIVAAHDCLNRETIERRRLDRGHVFHADERKIKRARDRRGREGEDIDELEKLFEFFLVQDSEALLFVDHDQTEFLENYVAGNDPVRADDDIDAAFAEELQDFALFGMRTKAAQHLDADWVIEHALPERFEMLLRQHRRRREDDDLFSFHDRFESGANGDFRFAKADVAANQPVHRARQLHVALGRGDGGELIGRFAKRERVLELALPFRVGTKGVAELRFAFGLDRQ